MNVRTLIKNNTIRITSRTVIYRLIKQGVIKASKVDGAYRIHELPFESVAISPELLAQIMGCSDRWIRRLCFERRLQAKKFGRKWLIDIKEAYSFIEKRSEKVK